MNKEIETNNFTELPMIATRGMLAFPQMTLSFDVEREASVRAADPSGSVRIIRVNSYEDAVGTARSAAVPGDVVLLSPASTSFDMFRNFEERGNTFKKLVMEL